MVDRPQEFIAPRLRKLCDFVSDETRSASAMHAGTHWMATRLFGDVEKFARNARERPLLDVRAVVTQKGKSHSQRKITNLLNHPEPYVTTSDLAGYWRVSRKQIYKQIDAGTLKAIRLGPRLLRISTTEAIRFEEMAKLSPEPVEDTASRIDRRDGDRTLERPRAVAADSRTPYTKQPQRPTKK